MEALLLILLLQLLQAAPQPQEPAEAIAARVARALSMPATEPEDPFRHFRLEGRLVFRYEDGRRLEQHGRVNLGGPARLRYELSTEQWRNVFVLGGPEQAWVLRAGERDFEDYPAANLARECWVRWTLLRLPWEQAASLRRPPEKEAAGRLRFSLTGPDGARGSVLLDAEGRPVEVELGPTRVEVSDWRPLRDGRLGPHRWLWHQSWGVLEEDFEVVEAGILYLDRAFRPPDRHLPTEDWSARALSDGREVGGREESLNLVRRPAVEVLLGPWPADWSAGLLEAGRIQRGIWHTPGAGEAEQGVAILTGDVPAALPDGVRAGTLSAGAWLHWSRVTKAATTEVARHLEDVARSNGLRPRGPALVLKTRQRGWTEGLLPVSLPRQH